MAAKKPKGSRDIFIIAGLTTLTIFTWIGLDVYRSFRKSTIPKVIAEQLRILNPALDTETINGLEKRLVVSEKELESLPSRRLTLVEEETTSTKTASPSANLSLPETASPSGAL